MPPALAYLKQMNGLSGLHLERAAHPYFTENETWVGSIYLGSLISVVSRLMRSQDRKELESLTALNILNTAAKPNLLFKRRSFCELDKTICYASRALLV